MADSWTDYDTAIKPTEDGWYPVEKFYDYPEGAIPGAVEWKDGKCAGMFGDRAIVRFGPRHETEEAAKAWAFENATDS